ncbi:YtxH domain-containing protein [Dysgonomonas sp. 520]|uniref:YtxH domain-containing protein n=1 Tax=Dysgonomonas sp. 520 TaxID=2302931 RepID=UPI0013CFD71C|nr:YtxH domain-containing protein [Dysgonomonas sp. 520]NDW09519.1 YtxH domain-containing protein [Dysgonomonas sp. 520]
MKKLLIGALAGAAIGVVVYKMAKDGKFDDLYDDASELAGKTKDKAEYYANRTNRKMKVAKRKLDRKVDDLIEKVDDLKGSLQEKMNSNKSEEAKA